MKRGGYSLCLLLVGRGKGRHEWENIFHKLDILGHKIFFLG